MNIGGQAYHDKMMAEARKWEQYARTLPDETEEEGQPAPRTDGD